MQDYVFHFSNELGDLPSCTFHPLFFPLNGRFLFFVVPFCPVAALHVAVQVMVFKKAPKIKYFA